MAFLNRVGTLVKQTVSKHVGSELSAPNPSLFQAIRSMSSSKLFVGGLSYSTDEMSLKEAFAQYGEVVEARVIMDRDTGRSRGFAFVTYTSTDAASSAIQAFDGQDLHGRTIKVNYATEKPRGGGFGGGGGYGGGGFGGGGGGGYGGGGYGGGGDNYGRGGYQGGGGDGGFGGGNQYPSGGGGFGGSSGGGSGFGGGDSVQGGSGGSFFSGNQTSFSASQETQGGIGAAENEGFGLGQDKLDENDKDDVDEPNDYANNRG
ncbi:hypothetical protein RD792_016805 [Penstemon davidsonii]|uniref:RRM domain-containing protein n=1 Tax=Penstemon davidsonii TaxID=160366 RepID=A0ABR0CL70_9LAMI|nr:hypothetical protein RD792_016805 [Penstemon davidsonii]